MRISALDSLRGIAALAVTVFHAILVFPALEPIHRPEAAAEDTGALLLAATPAGLLWAGREAVLLFFVLSGFVLALGFGREQPGWPAFAARRMVRLLPPCIVVALLLAVMVPLIEPRPRPEFTDWFNAAWNAPVTPGLVAGHALLLLDSYVLNSPMWTLHYELRISLIFPLVALLVSFGSLVLLAGTAVAVLVCLMEMKFIGSGVLTTALFLPHFAFGAILARHRQVLGDGIGRLGGGARLLLWLLCYLLLKADWYVPGNDLVISLVNGAGAALLIALVLGTPWLQAALCRAPLPWLGAISYSLYLVHVPVLLAMLHLGTPELPAWLLAALAPLASLPLAWLLYRFVERPSIRLGRLVSDRLEARRPRAAPVAASR